MRNSDVNTCHRIIYDGYADVDEEFISIEILLKVYSNSSIKLKAIQHHFKDLYNVKISYPKAS